MNKLKYVAEVSFISACVFATLPCCVHTYTERAVHHHHCDAALHQHSTAAVGAVSTASVRRGSAKRGVIVAMISKFNPSNRVHS